MTTSAIRRSNAIAPKPSQIGRYADTKGTNDVEHADRRERVGDHHDDVHDDEHHDQQRHVAVHEFDDEARPVRAAPAERREDAEQDARGEEREAHHARGAGHVPGDAPRDASSGATSGTVQEPRDVVCRDGG